MMYGRRFIYPLIVLLLGVICIMLFVNKDPNKIYRDNINGIIAIVENCNYEQVHIRSGHGVEITLTQKESEELCKLLLKEISNVEFWNIEDENSGGYTYFIQIGDLSGPDNNLLGIPISQNHIKLYYNEYTFDKYLESNTICNYIKGIEGGKASY